MHINTINKEDTWISKGRTFNIDNATLTSAFSMKSEQLRET